MLLIGTFRSLKTLASNTNTLRPLANKTVLEDGFAKTNFNTKCAPQPLQINLLFRNRNPTAIKHRIAEFAACLVNFLLRY
jgi:hypothetical protein